MYTLYIINIDNCFNVIYEILPFIHPELYPIVISGDILIYIFLL